jgi:hypothetical protein
VVHGACGKSVNTWSDMKQKFLLKYKDYYKGKYRCEEIFKMTQKEEESLEHYIERFQYNFQRYGIKLDKNTQQIVMLRGMRDECI